MNGFGYPLKLFGEIFLPRPLKAILTVHDDATVTKHNRLMVFLGCLRGHEQPERPYLSPEFDHDANASSRPNNTSTAITVKNIDQSSLLIGAWSSPNGSSVGSYMSHPRHWPEDHDGVDIDGLVVIARHDKAVFG